MSENIDINVGIIKEEISINAANNIVEVNISTAPVIIINPQDYDLSQFTNTSPNPFVQQSSLASYVPISRNITINGVTQNLTTDRSWTISTGITIGTTLITSGTVGRVLFEGTGNVVQESANLFWDNTNGRLGIGGSPAVYNLDVKGIGIYRGGLLDLQNTTGNFTLSFYPSSGNIGIINSDILRLGRISNSTVFLQGFASGNVGINTTTDAGFRLDVNGTARVSGNVTVSLNQNGQTKTTLSNTTSGTSSRVDYILTSDGGAGEANFGKFSSTTTTYKILAARDTFLYNNPTAGDISMLNDFATGRIKFAAGGASTAQMTLFSTGNLAINTTTDAGFRLDVNGTGRVQGQLDLGNASTDGFLYSSPSVAMRFGGGQTTNTFTFTQINSGRFQPAGTTEQAHVLMTVGQAESTGQENRGSVIRHTGTVSTSNGNAIFSNFQTNNTINTTGGTTIYRGFYHNPTLTSLTGVTHRAIETTSGNIIFNGGNVGIGTSSPAYPLDIRSTTQGTTLAIRNNGTPGQGNSTAQLYLSNIDGYTSQLTLSNNGIVLNTHGNASTFTINGYLSVGSLFRVLSTGNVLINTTTDAGYKLDVNGSARFITNGGLSGLYVNNTATFVNRTILVIGAGDGTAITQGLQISVNTSTGKSYINGWNDGGSAQYDIVVGGAGSRTQFGTDSASVASAQVAINSTTRGFLPPRMTTTEINAIASPAEGLMVYNTTISHMCVYQAGSWVKINHSPM